MNLLYLPFQVVGCGQVSFQIEKLIGGGETIFIWEVSRRRNRFRETVSIYSREW